MAQPIQPTTISYSVTTASAGPFVVPFRFYSASDLIVTAGGVPVTFTATGVGEPAGGAVTLTAAVSSTTVVISRQTAPARLTDFPETGPFRISRLNLELDRLTATDQDLDRRLTADIADLAAFKAYVESVKGEFAGGDVVAAQYVATEGQTVFTLPRTMLGTSRSALVFVGGVPQPTTAYTISGDVLTLAQGVPVAGTLVDVRLLGEVEAEYTPDITGVTREGTGGSFTIRFGLSDGSSYAITTPDLTGPAGPQGPQGLPGTGSGDVTGPASATDGAMALFDGTTGKLLKAGGAPFVNPMTTMGDMIIGGASGAPFRLPLGAPRSFVVSDGSTPVMRAFQLADLPSQADLTVLGRNGSSGTPVAVSTPMLSVVTAADAAAARTNLGAAASGAVTASGLTMATARLLGRTTASTGAVEEISVGTGLTLSGGTLTASAVAPGMVLIATATASNSATIDFTGIDSTYDTYVVVGVGVQPANASGIYARVQVSGTWQTADYVYSSSQTTSASVTISVDNGTGDQWVPVTNTVTADANGGAFFVMYLGDPASTTRRKLMDWKSTCQNSTNIRTHSGGGQWTGGTGAVTGLRFLASSGNITAGKFFLYGLRRTV